MQAPMTEEYSSYLHLISLPDGAEWWESRPGRALLPVKGPRYSLDRGWVGLRAGLEEISFASTRDRNPVV
jgi:hypothetical protein